VLELFKMKQYAGGVIWPIGHFFPQADNLCLNCFRWYFASKIEL